MIGGMRIAVFACVVVASGCGDDGNAASDAATVDAMVDAAIPIDVCPAGSFANGVTAGQVTCIPVDEARTKTTIDARCSMYLGFRDSCDGCTTAPAKWGSSGALSCTNGAGAGNTCSTATVDGAPINLFGLDLDGDTDGNDKIHGSLHCITAARAMQPAPCRPDWFITGKVGSSFMCAPMSETVVAYVRDSCAVYLGWQDGCDGCTRPPVKWGYASSKQCMNGSGADNTCATATLGGESINLFGLNFDGDVDGNDKLHAGLHCRAPAPPEAPTATACPTGSFLVGLDADGSVQCESALPVIQQYFAAHCEIVFGWRDGCGACSDPPAKFGTVRSGACTTSGGTDDTCTDHVLGDATVSMYGLSPDGDVDDNDKLYFGLRCR